MIAKKEVLDLINERIKKAKKRLNGASDPDGNYALWESSRIFEMESLCEEIEKNK